MSPAAPFRRARDRVGGLRSLHGQLLALLVVKGLIIVAAMSTLVVFAVQADGASVRARGLNAAQTDLARALTEVVEQDGGVRAFLLTGDPTFLRALDAGPDAVTGRLTAVRGALATAHGSTASLDALEGAYRRWLTDVTATEVGWARGGRLEQARALETETGSAAPLGAIRAAAQQVWTDIDAARQTATSAATDARLRVIWLVVGVLVMLVGALAVATVMMRAAVLRPLRRLRCATRRVAGGAWEQTVPSAGPTEIAELAADVERMREALVEHAAHERRNAEALHQQGPAVLALRRALEPSPWAQPGFDVAARLEPAEGVLAGDWYDVITLDEDRIGVVVGDVAGHGAGSGVYAMRLKNLLRASLRFGRGPAAVITGLATHIAEYPDDERVACGELFATVFVAVVDRRDGMLTYASAGHLDAVVLHPAPAGGHGGTTTVGRRDLPSTGPMLSALLTGPRWREDVRLFQPGDVLVVTTDGVLEARRDDDEFGADRLVAAVAPALVRGTDTPGDLGAALGHAFDALDGFEVRARDDRTLVLVQLTDTPTRFPAARVGTADGAAVVVPEA